MTRPLALAVFTTCLLFNIAVAELVDMQPLPVEPDVPAQHDGYQSIPLHVAEHAGVARMGHPVRGGIPFPEGAVTDFTSLRVVDEQGEPVAAQLDVLSRWWDFDEARGAASDYSIKWLAVSFLTDLEPNQTRTYRLQYGAVEPHQFNGVNVRAAGDVLHVNTGALRATFSRATGVLMQIDRRAADGWEAMLSAPAELFAEVKGYRPTAGGLWTVLQPLNDRAAWRFLPDADGVGEHIGFHQHDYDDTSWPHADPFEPWETQGYATHDGDGWYRTWINADSTWQGRAVYLELRDQVWYPLSLKRKLTVFLNGAEIATLTGRGAVKPTDDENWKQRRVRLPDDLLTYGENNLITIRAYDDGDGMGGLMCVPAIVTPHDKAKDGPYPDPSGRYTNHHGDSAKLTVLREGPQRASIEVTGWLHDETGRAQTMYRLGYAFHAGSALMDVQYSFTQTDDPYLARIQSAGLTLPIKIDAGATAMCTGDQSLALRGNDDNLTIHQYHDGEGRYPGYPTLADTPFKPTYDVTGNGETMTRGQRATGWMSLGGATVSMRDFWRDYPSQITARGDGALTAYMWPDAGPEMDLRMWADRKDGGWEQLETDAAAREKVAQSARSLAVRDSSTGEAITLNSAIGVSWTRELRYAFHATAPEPAAAEAAAVAWDQPVYPFVTAQWNCATEAAGMPLHPYDPENFPVLEAAYEATIAMARLANHKWLNIFGMFQRGALRYRLTLDPGNIVYFKTDWSRRWFNQESGKSPAMTPLVQYLRTGHLPHLDFGGELARFASHISIRTFHRVPLRTGYAARHRYTVFGIGTPSHTNIEGIILYHCLTGDENARAFLDKLNQQYRQEPIERFTVVGNWIDREHDSPLLCRLLLWDLDGEEWQRRAVLDGLAYYRTHDLAGFTNIGGATYRIAHMTRMWYRTRDPQLLPMMAEPLPYFVDGSTDGLFELYQLLRLRHLEMLTFLSGDQLMTRDEIEKAVTPANTRKIALGSLVYPGHKLAAFHRAGVKRLTVDPAKNPQMGRYHGRFRDMPDFAPAQGARFEPIDLRSAVNADPHAIVNPPVQPWPWMGQYHTYNDQVPPFDPSLAPGEIAWDMGAVENTAPGWHRGYRRSIWPTFEGYEKSSNFVGYPFGARIAFNGVPFDLIDPATNDGRGLARTDAGKTVDLPIGRKATRLFFLGHVINGKQGGGLCARYHVRYADGQTQSIDLIDGLHADRWRNTGNLAADVRPVQFARVWDKHYSGGAYFGGYLHLNLFELTTDGKREIESVALEGVVEGFCLLAVTAEVAGAADAPDPRVVYEASDDNAVTFGQPLTVDLPDGAYDVTLDLPRYKTVATVYAYDDVQVSVEAQGQLAVTSFSSRFGSGLTFPAFVSGGKLTLTIHAAGQQPQPSVIERVTVTPRADPVSWAAARRDIDSLHRYGWKTDPIEVGSQMGEGMIDYPRRDLVTRDWVDGTDNTFIAAVANGKYKLTILVMAPMGHPAFAPEVNGNKTPPIELPRQRWAYGDPRVSRAFEAFETFVDVTDGVLNIAFPPGAEGYRWGRTIAVRGIKLTPVSDAQFAQGKVAVTGVAGPTNTEWQLRFEETFDGDELNEDHWQVIDGGSWTVEDGQVSGRGTLLCKLQFPGAQRVTYRARSTEPCDLSAILCADWSGFRGGYFVGFGSENNAFGKLMRQLKEIHRWQAIITPGKWHEVIVERDGDTLRQWVDGDLKMTYTDNAPIRGAMIGFNVWTTGTFDDIRVYTKRDR